MVGGSDDVSPVPPVSSDVDASANVSAPALGGGSDDVSPVPPVSSDVDTSADASADVSAPALGESKVSPPGEGKTPELTADVSKGPFKKFKVVDGPMRVQHDGTFPHFEVTPAPSVLTHFGAEDYEWFLHQYVGTLMRSLQTHGRQGILESLTLLIETLAQVKYGDKLLDAVRWYASTMEAWMAVPVNDAPRFARELVVAQALVKARLEKGHGHERIVCTVLHQMLQNGMDALAKANSVEGLRRLLESRFSPETYKRRTAPASAGQLTVAMSHFRGSGFTMPKLMSLDELLASYGGVAVATDQSTDVCDVWAASAAQLKKKTASNFASRVAASRFIAPKTFEELVIRIMAGEMSGLEVEMDGQTPLCLTVYH